MWDETNLEENEKIKAEFANVHIDEPDTPFNREFRIEDEVDDTNTESIIDFTHFLFFSDLGSVTPELLTAALNALANGDIENNTKKPRFCETKSEFEQRRKEHYDEYRRMKEFKAAHKTEEIEEIITKGEEESEGEATPSIKNDASTE